MSRLTHDDLLAGRVYTRSIINEPIDFTIDFTVQEQSAIEKAKRRWRTEPVVITEDKDER